MYEKIELEFPQDVEDWQNKDVVETPFIELSDEEEVDIEENNNDDDDSNDRPSTNPGKGRKELQRKEMMYV